MPGAVCRLLVPLAPAGPFLSVGCVGLPVSGLLSLLLVLLVLLLPLLPLVPLVPGAVSRVAVPLALLAAGAGRRAALGGCGVPGRVFRMALAVAGLTRAGSLVSLCPGGGVSVFGVRVCGAVGRLLVPSPLAVS